MNCFLCICWNIIHYLFYEYNNYNYYNVGNLVQLTIPMFFAIYLVIKIISTSVHLAIVTSTTGLPTVTPAETDTNDVMNYTTIVIATSSSAIILFIIVTSVLVIIILYSRIHNKSG